MCLLEVRLCSWNSYQKKKKERDEHNDTNEHANMEEGKLLIMSQYDYILKIR